MEIVLPSFVAFILHTLKTAGYEAYVVGGAVRDALCNRPVTDWDVVTAAKPDRIKSVFSHIRHFALKPGTVTLVYQGKPYEISTFRGPKQTLVDDLARRDFSINAMAYDAEQNAILDFHGGMADMDQKIIRATGDPDARFREDPLRLLRAVRLSLELWFHIADATRQAMIRMAPLLSQTAPERIREELMKSLLCRKPSRGLRCMRQTGLLSVFLPELLEGYLKRQNPAHRYTIFRHILETVDRVPPCPVLRLAALFHDIAKPRVRKKINNTWRFYGHETASAELCQTIMQKLRFSNVMIREVTALVKHHMVLYRSEWRDSAVRRLIARVGERRIMDLLCLRKADVLAQGLQEQSLSEVLMRLQKLENRINKVTRGPLPTRPGDLAIDGNKVMATLDLPQGPEVGGILKMLLEKVTDHPHLNTEQELTAVLEDMKKKQHRPTK